MAFKVAGNSRCIIIVVGVIGMNEDDDYEKALEELRKISRRTVRINRLSERGTNIVDHPELMDSIEDTDPIWHELYEYIVGFESYEVEEVNLIEEKAKEVRKWLSDDDEIGGMLSPL